MVNKYICILIALYSSTGCIQDKRKVITYDDVSIELASYEDSENNISIQYPILWELSAGSEDVVFVVREKKINSNTSLPKTIHITRMFETDTSNVDLEKLIYSSNIDMKKSFDEFKIISTKEVVVNGNSAIVQKSSFNTNGFDVTTSIYFIDVNTNIFQVGCTSESSEFKDFEMFFEYVSKTFDTI